jgi:hypothetical protein
MPGLVGSGSHDDVEISRLREGFHYIIVMQVFSFSSSFERYSSGIDNQGAPL